MINYHGGGVVMLRVSMVLLLMLLAAPVAAQEEDPFGSSESHLFALRGTLFELSPGSSELAAMETAARLGTVYATRLNVEPRDFSHGFPGISHRYEWFGVDYVGWLRIDKAGLHRFSLHSDDGSRLYIDGNLVVDNDGVHGPQERVGEVDLARGLHRVRVQYFQGPRYSVALKLAMWDDGKGAFETVDTERMGPGRIERRAGVTTVSMHDYVLFEGAGGRLTPYAPEVLQEVYRALIAGRDAARVDLTVGGADARARADSVRDALCRMGLRPARVKVHASPAGAADVVVKVTVP